MPIKIKQIKKTDNINKNSMDDISSLFGKMFGDNPVLDPEIIYTRYNNIKSYLSKLKQIIEIFYKFEIINDICTENVQLLDDYNKIHIFINDLDTYIKNEINFKYNLDEMRKPNYTINDVMNSDNLYDMEKSKELTEHYKKIKKSEYINVAIELLKNMQPYKTYISDDLITECKWLSDLPGHTYEIFPFTSLNIKFIYDYKFEDVSINVQKKKFIANVFNKLFKCCSAIYNLITDVDFDISIFTDIILNNIDSLKKELPRCDNAFNVIIIALNKIKTNFKHYYKEFEITNDPTIIIQNFIKDIYDENKSDPILISQLKKIISHFSNKIKSNTKIPPNISNLIDNLNNISFKTDMNQNTTSTTDILNTIKIINNNISSIDTDTNIIPYAIS